MMSCLEYLPLIATLIGMPADEQVTMLASAAAADRAALQCAMTALAAVDLDEMCDCIEPLLREDGV
jgi:hypothetical protein